MTAGGKPKSSAAVAAGRVLFLATTSRTADEEHIPIALLLGCAFCTGVCCVLSFPLSFRRLGDTLPFYRCVKANGVDGVNFFSVAGLI
jgi:hypothetical protein